MSTTPAMARRRPWQGKAVPLVLLGLLQGGCAGPSGSLFGKADPAPLFRDQRITLREAGDAVVVGRSTRDEIRAALGTATVVRFDSGYEVWAYRGSTPGTIPAGVSEFVILFGPDGVARKSRVRAPSGP